MTIVFASSTEQKPDRDDQLDRIESRVTELAEMLADPVTSIQDHDGRTIWLSGSGWLR